MFWGLIMEPSKRYSQQVEKSFHVSGAALETSSGDSEPVQVMIGFEERSYLVCTLQRGKTLQAPLDLNFEAGDTISFSSNGNCHVHLTGYMVPEDDTLDFGGSSDEDEDVTEDMEAEIPTLVPIQKEKRKGDSSVKPAKAKKIKLHPVVAPQPEEESSSDDDDYNPDGTADPGSEEETDDTVDSDDSTTLLGAVESDDESDEESEQEQETPKKPEPPKKTKKDKKKETPPSPPAAQTNGVVEKKSKKEKRKEKKNKENEVKPDQSLTSPVKKTINGGVSIEDLTVGQGQVAKAGRNVQVYYEGRLKSNNKVFDSTNKGPGFRFHLGRSEVIKGWDVGVAGMRVGGKRRIVCPPNMAYGAKGSPPVIPPNSTLVFEVELRNVH